MRIALDEEGALGEEVDAPRHAGVDARLDERLADPVGAAQEALRELAALLRIEAREQLDFFRGERRGGGRNRDSSGN
jgi:hypothetical protein